MNVHDVKSFKRAALELFGISFPKHVVFEERDNAIRAYSKHLMQFKSRARGLAVYSLSKQMFTHAFALAFGHLAVKNKLHLKKEEMCSFTSKKPFNVDVDDGTYIAFYRGVALGIVRVDKGIAYPQFQSKFKREVCGS